MLGVKEKIMPNSMGISLLNKKSRKPMAMTFGKLGKLDPKNLHNCSKIAAYRNNIKHIFALDWTSRKYRYLECKKLKGNGDVQECTTPDKSVIKAINGKPIGK